MPCTYIESAQEIADRERKSKRRTVAPYKMEVDKVTRLLCFMLTQVSGTDSASMNPDFMKALADNTELRSWWIDHQHRDELAALKKKQKKEKV